MISEAINYFGINKLRIYILQKTDFADQINFCRELSNTDIT